MKNIQSIWKFLTNPGMICMILTLCISTACEDGLMENPKSLAVETFYNTPKEVEAAVNAIYSPLRQAYYTIGFNSTHSDYALGRGSWAPLNDFEGLNSVWITRISEVWTYYYQGIRNANIVINNAPKGKAISQADIDKYVGEAKFLRAFTYFQLVRHWGGVPIRTELNINELETPRSTEENVYELILEDLIDAEAKLPNDQPVSGRPNKMAAKTLLADVYLQLGQYEDARDKAQEVIQSQKYSLVPVATVDDFQNIFGANVVTTPEEVFYLKFSHEPGQGDTWPGLMNHPATGLYGGGGVYGVHSDSSLPFYIDWDDDDLRKALWYPFNIGVGATSLLSKKLIDPQSLSLGGAGNPQTWYRYADVLLIFAEAEARAENSTTAEAMEALNMVHRRAYGYPPTASSPVDFNAADYPGDSFIDLVVKERGYEFQLEGKRWVDLKRLGMLEEIILAAKGKSVTEVDYLWPIPVAEMSANKALDPSKDQNPGY
jgi:tetratricopeptide (TPR) repeat protein